MIKIQSEKAIVLKNKDELLIMHQANQIVADVLKMVKKHIRPGISTYQLDKLAESLCKELGGVPAFKGYRGFPASLCVSINEQIVHGIPSKKVTLREGDIISVDFGVKYNGFYGDHAITIPVGSINSEKQKLIEVTRESLNRAITKVKVGNRIGDISKAVQDYVESQNFSVVRQFVGHGIGSQLHESPEIPNYVQAKATPRILEGMVLAIEPMVNCGTYEVRILKDQWTVVTADSKPSAHFEHSVAVTSDGPWVLSG